MNHRVLGEIVWGIVIASAIILIALAALAHDEFRCGPGPYKSAGGGDCCAANRDCHPIDNDAAWSAVIGSRIDLPSQSAWRSMTVSVIHPSCDDHGRPWACWSGCLFRGPGM